MWHRQLSCCTEVPASKVVWSGTCQVKVLRVALALPLGLVLVALEC